ncbi:MAG TPA: hypothetical protein VM490_26550 [Armatimonadaceae bacterium]|jgi:hypothetical protein|nr:hypothetical protein [Armatimonadaceae bacterium]
MAFDLRQSPIRSGRAPLRAAGVAIVLASVTLSLLGCANKEMSNEVDTSKLPPKPAAGGPGAAPAAPAAPAQATH